MVLHLRTCGQHVLCACPHKGSGETLEFLRAISIWESTQTVIHSRERAILNLVSIFLIYEISSTKACEAIENALSKDILNICQFPFTTKSLTSPEYHGGLE